jgi:predicted transcriptional regulator
MSQAGIIKALEKEDWLSVKDLIRILKVSKTSINASLIKLRKTNEVARKRKELPFIKDKRRSHYLYSLPPK